MLRFCAANSISSGPLDAMGVCRVIEEVTHPGHFFVGHELELAWETGKAEEVSWEVFHGRLLDPAHTRERRSFLAWNVYQVTGGERSGEPLLAVKFDPRMGQLHVVRGLLCRVWEGYGDSVIHTRETSRWVRELVGAIELADFADADDLADELICLVWQAVVGTSRLPLHSLETPLPAFSLGQLAYVQRPAVGDGDRTMSTTAELVERGLHEHLNWREKAKLLEAVLRAGSGEPACWIERWRGLGHTSADLARLFRRVFNEVSLSPWTGFVDSAMGWWRSLREMGFFTRSQHIDFVGHLLRQLARHLTAYDLVVFHHRGANYPDALLLDTLLGEYLVLIEQAAEDFAADDAVGRRRRRALRQACLLRRHYEGHAVPDAPTSPGENARVLPEPFVAPPEEQVLQPARRRKRLFADRPLASLLSDTARRILEQSFADLRRPEEMTELGVALFIDRPFGAAKAPGEPDQTPLLAHECFSVTLANGRLRSLVKLAEEMKVTMPANLEVLPVRGVPMEQIADPGKPTVSLADARKVADDFVVLRTVGAGLEEFWSQVDAPRMAGAMVVARTVGVEGDVRVTVWDAEYRPRMVCVIVGNAFRRRAEYEFPCEVRIVPS